MLILLHPDFDDVTDFTRIQKGGLCPSKLLPVMTEFSVSMLLLVIATENNWLGDAFLKVYNLTQKTKPREMKTR